MTTFRGFATLNVWADEVAVAARWYAEVFGVEPYFERSGSDGRPAYVEFRVGDTEAEFGIISSAYRPQAGDGPAGAILHWAVDDLEATVARLRDLGAVEYLPVEPRGEGFVTASVVDPFGNLLGVMSNPHFLEVLERP
ncbi:VOC family protein [Pseudonocardia broussonetiae]|uniref:VOC family protein n=1 Tax=Pseudonocardia broussonetiae TaxID=2736640 RepID=A0A6M6JQ60_9PSEU|nr:VOC family protein [Pseudonocardia broussonetiae]QJY48722.1 VOC family protein [Pseudonocardia broussonetiae]